MVKGDRTTKALLALIALFLGILVGKSLLQATPLAKAASSTTQLGNLQNYNPVTRNGQNVIMGYRTVPVSTLTLNTKEKLRSIMVMDQAQAFLVQYDDRVEVYRVDGIQMNNPDTTATTDQTSTQQ